MRLPRSEFLVSLLAGFCCFCSAGTVEPSLANQETPPLPENSAESDWQRQQARAIQERFRLRVPVPEAVRLEIPTERPGSLSAPLLRARGPGLWLGSLFCLAGLLGIRWFAPQFAESLNSLLNPWALSSTAIEANATTTDGEEQAFNEFLAAFRGGPACAPRSIPAPAPEHMTDQTPVDPLKECLAQAPVMLRASLKLLLQIKQQADPPTRQKELAELGAQVRSLKGMAALPELIPLWQLAAALEGLVKQLADKPPKVTPSTLATVGTALELLQDLCRPELRPDLCSNPPLRFLAVDDDMICRHAVTLALKKAFNVPDSAANGEAALVLAAKHAYDGIFLDIQMPGMDGFELCSKIHQTALNLAAPVVFVTCHDTEEARAKSELCGGRELLSKPFLTFEITVKALTLALRTRLKAPDTLSSPPPPVPEVPPLVAAVPEKQTLPA